MSETTIRAAADHLLRFASETGADNPAAVIRAYTLGAVGQAARNALGEVEALLALPADDQARVLDDALARIRSSLLDALDANRACDLALAAYRLALGDCPEPHGARRTGGGS